MPAKKAAPPSDDQPSDDQHSDDQHSDLDDLSYEEAREELIKVVQQLESGGAPLAESLALWERGEKLAAVCQRWLDGAKAKIQAAADKRESADAD